MGILSDVAITDDKNMKVQRILISSSLFGFAASMNKLGI